MPQAPGISTPTRAPLARGRISLALALAWLLGLAAFPGHAAASIAGGWAVINSPNTSASQGNELYDVAALGPSDIWAVGHGNNGTNDQTLAQHWNGSGWSIVATANVSPSSDNYLNGLACLNSAYCWATGHTGHLWCTAAPNCQTLIERWNGSSWSIVTSPNTSSAEQNTLVGVAVVSASDAWAVGHSVNAGGYPQTLAVHWNGAAWTMVPTPDTAANQDNRLERITCVSSSACWAVGSGVVGGAYQTLIERWDGAAWSIVASPNSSPTENNGLRGVSCMGAGSCWAAGAYYTGPAGSKVYRTLMERWNGATWSIVASPNNGTGDNYPLDVVAVSPNAAWMVGYFSASDRQPLVEGWDGAAWSVTAAPSPNTGFTQLLRVTALSSSNVWAVGYSRPTGGINRTLIEQFDPNRKVASSITGVSVTPTTSTFGQTITLSATVGGAGSTPTGSVTFYDNGASVGTALIGRGGQAALTPNPPGAGAHSWTAVYAGDANYLGSSSPAATATTVAAATTTVVLTATQPVASTADIVITVSVTANTGATPSGSVVVNDNGAALTTIQLGSTGQGTFTTTWAALPPGRNDFTAAYAGSSPNFGPATSTTATLSVGTTPGATPTDGASSGQPGSFDVNAGIPVAAPSADNGPGLAAGVFNAIISIPGRIAAMGWIAVSFSIILLLGLLTGLTMWLVARRRRSGRLQPAVKF